MVAATAFRDFVGRIFASDIILEGDAGGGGVRITSADPAVDFDAHLPGYPLEDYPAIAGLATLRTMPPQAHVSQQVIRELFRRVSYVVPESEKWNGAYLLDGLQLSLDNDTLTLSGFDGYRGATASARLCSEGVDLLHVFIPRSTVKELPHILADVGAPLALHVAPDCAGFLCSGTGIELWTQIASPRFPRWDEIVPPTFATAFVFARERLLEILRLNETLARSTFEPTILRIAGTGEADAAQSMEVRVDIEANWNNARLDVLCEGVPRQIAFEGRHLREALSAMHVADVRLALADDGRSGVLSPATSRLSPIVEQHIIAALSTDKANGLYSNG